MKAGNEEQKIRQKIIGTFLKTARENAGITQHALATQLSYTSPQFVSNWERGQSMPPLDMLPRLSKILRIGAREMIDALYEYQDEILKLQKKQLRDIFRKQLRANLI